VKTITLLCVLTFFSIIKLNFTIILWIIDRYIFVKKLKRSLLKDKIGKIDF